jgi:GR25 family glycosyltransferase involved in LPS biosynthesis
MRRIDELPGSVTCKAPCLNLHVQYINLKSNVVRDDHMRRTLASAYDAQRCPFQVHRAEGVEPRCQRGGPCKWNHTKDVHSRCAWSEFKVYHEIERAYTKKFGDSRRAGSLGSWLSHASAWDRFSQQHLNGGTQSEYLLVLEDDTIVTRGFFEQLPCMLNALPTGAWHAARFSTWGTVFDEDRVHWTRPGIQGNMAIARAPPDFSIYHARPHPYNGSGYESFPYGGVHAVLVQRKTVGQLLQYALNMGAMPVDVALRTSPPRTGHRGAAKQAHRDISALSTAPSNSAPSSPALHVQVLPSIESFVIMTPTVGVKRMGSWRRDA